MLSEFLQVERRELIDRCKAKVLLRPNAGTGTQSQLQHGIPQFLDQPARRLPSSHEGDIHIEVTEFIRSTAAWTMRSRVP